jgi:hypothetical protein
VADDQGSISSQILNTAAAPPISWKSTYGVFAKLAAIYCFGRPGQRLLGLMIRVMSCIIAHEPGTSTPEFSSTTIVIRSDGRY